MAQIIPAIIPKSQENLIQILSLVSSFTHSVQVDIVDGEFVPFVSWPYTENASLSELALVIKDFDVEIDFMILGPELVVEEYLKAGVTSIVVHLESTKNLDKILALKEKYSFKLGLSIGNDTNLSILTEAIEVADYVQLMGIQHIGSQGQPFDIRVLDRIRELKSRYPTLPISIDGSVNMETASLLVQAGADRLVSGSAVLKAEDPQIAYKLLKSL
ncbi:MAG: hypothetical protein K9M10_00680 [Candidatus Pacebacteria bacterium]|nr:hypothetical protein [Candidatus Paceibacterota bacterium]MCF7856978.1 hypothetical protein [Candidatus Paceibacterota bacterium]